MTRGGFRTIEFRGPSPEIVCICGPIWAEREMRDAFENVALAGGVAVGPPPLDGVLPPDGKSRKRLLEKLEQLQYRKIDMADRVEVICPTGKPDESLQRQIDYAIAYHVPVRMLAGRTPGVAYDSAETDEETNA
jgi:hypothetical protein